VSDVSGEEVINTQHIIVVRKRAFAEVRAEKACATQRQALPPEKHLSELGVFEEQGAIVAMFAIECTVDEGTILKIAETSRNSVTPQNVFDRILWHGNPIRSVHRTSGRAHREAPRMQKPEISYAPLRDRPSYR
jgi:hypothetical protein